MVLNERRTRHLSACADNPDSGAEQPPAHWGDFAKPRKRAFVRKTVHPRTRGPMRLLGNVDTLKSEATNIEFINLNKQVLKDITTILESDQCADLGDIIFQYESFIEEIAELASSMQQPLPSTRSSWAGRVNMMRDMWADAGLCKSYRDFVFGAESKAGTFGYEHSAVSSEPRRLNATHEALHAMFDRTIEGKRNKDSLSQLLDANFQQEAQSEPVFPYVRIEDIIKSKGNSIKGPKREDVGRYNRKLFDMQFNSQQAPLPVKVSLNPRFFRELSDIAQTSEIVKCEMCVASYFHCGESYEVGEFFLVVHTQGQTTLCTVKSEGGLLFDGMEKDSVHAIYFAGCANILFLYYDTFILYNLAFTSVEAASSVYEAFFCKINCSLPL